MISSENRYSGIPTIYAEMEKHNLRPPVFESKQGYFKVTLYNSPVEEYGMDSKILEFCKIPRSREEISNKFNVSSKAYFVHQYINPLLESGELKETIPDKPKSKHQKYYAI